MVPETFENIDSYESCFLIIIFTGCAESLLETLTDITHGYYLQFTKHLRAAADNQAQHNPSGFPVRLYLSHVKTCLMSYANNKGADQSAQSAPLLFAAQIAGYSLLLIKSGISKL